MGEIRCEKHGSTGVIDISPDILEWVYHNKKITENEIVLVCHNFYNLREEFLFRFRYFASSKFLVDNELKKENNLYIDDLDDEKLETMNDGIPATSGCCIEHFKEFLEYNNMSNLWEEYRKKRE